MKILDIRPPSIENIDSHSEAKEKIISLIEQIKLWVGEVTSKQEMEYLFTYLKDYHTSYQSWSIPWYIKTILSLGVFQEYVNQYIYDHVGKVLNDNALECFEELSFFLFLLGRGEVQEILLDLQTYDFDSFGEVFDVYLDEMKYSKNDPIKFEDAYRSFINLCSIWNELCILNQVDIVRKALIPRLSDLMTKKIEILFQNFQMILSQEHTNELEYIIARFGINFTHTQYFDMRWKTTSSILETFSQKTQEIYGSFLKAKQTNFWNTPQKHDPMKQIAIGNMSYTILTWLKKISKNTLENQENIMENPFYQEICKMWWDITEQDVSRIVSPEQLKENCLSQFGRIFSSNSWSQETLETSEVINMFMSTENCDDVIEIETVYNIVLFDEIDETKMIHLWEFLLENDKYINYNFEFFKLKILDTIVIKLTQWGISTQVDSFLSNLIAYIEKNKVSSQLLDVYSKIYLSIAHFYSYRLDQESQNKAMKYYTFFSKIHQFSELQNIHKNEITEIDYNIGDFILHNQFPQPSQWECLPHFSPEQRVVFGQKEIEKFQYNYDLRLQNKLWIEISKLFEHFFVEPSMLKQVHLEISQLLEKRLFYGVAQTDIVHTGDIDIHLSTLSIPPGKEVFYAPIYEDYYVIFTYPKKFQTLVENIFKNQNEIILTSIRNFIFILLKTKDSLIDKLTWLPNETQLRLLLSTLEDSYSFISIKLITLPSIISGYGSEVWDMYVKTVCEHLEKIPHLRYHTYKLSDENFGFLLPNDEGIFEVLEQIQKIKFSILGTEFPLDCAVGIAENVHPNYIIEYSRIALDASVVSGGTPQIYNKILWDTSAQSKLEIQRLRELDDALENDRVFPFYQPIVDHQGKVLKYEALMRIQKRDGMIGSPFEYLDVAYKYGRRKAITFKIIQCVMKKAVACPMIDFSINLSGGDLWDMTVISELKKWISENGIIPSRITLEIVEGEWDTKNNHLSQIEDLKRFGFRIAMDDFWAKHSNVLRLIDLMQSQVLDEIKIDGNIIRSLVEKHSDFAPPWTWKKPMILPNWDETYFLSSYEFSPMVFKQWTPHKEDSSLSLVTKDILKGIILWAHRAHIKVIAEYIENDHLQEITQSLWIDGYQWYYHGKPQAELQDSIIK